MVNALDRFMQQVTLVAVQSTESPYQRYVTLLHGDVSADKIEQAFKQLEKAVLHAS